MSVEFLAGGAALTGLMVIMACHDVLRGMRMKRALIATARPVKR